MTTAPLQSTRNAVIAHRLLVAFLALCLLLSVAAQFARLRTGAGHQLFDGDGFFYYAYLPNLILKGNLDFSEAYARYQPQGPMWSRIVPETGRWSNVWSVGPAVMWLPGFLLGHLVWFVARLAGRAGPTDGFDLYHEGGALAAALAWSLLAVWLTYRLCRRLAAPLPAALATIAVWAGTPLLAYGFLELDMSHAVGMLVITALLLASITAREQPQNPWCWAACGGLVGLAALIRPQHAVFAIIPVGAWLLARREATITPDAPRLRFSYLMLMLPAAALAFAPQMLTWKAIFGHYLVVAQPNYFSQLSFAQLLASLFSTRHGYFSWTPLWAPALAGLLLAPKQWRWLAALIGVSLLLQVLLNAWARDWSGGEAFGARRLVEIGPGLAIGLAAILSRLMSRRAMLGCGLAVFALTYWNLALMARYYLRAIPHEASVPVYDFIRATLLFPFGLR